jgi:hypothetical protein
MPPQQLPDQRLTILGRQDDARDEIRPLSRQSENNLVHDRPPARQGSCQPDH